MQDASLYFFIYSFVMNNHVLELSKTEFLYNFLTLLQQDPAAFFTK